MSERNAIINGVVEAGRGDRGAEAVIQYERGADTTISFKVIGDEGGLVNLTGATGTLKVYDDYRRRTLVASQAITDVNLATGDFSVVIADDHAEFSVIPLLPRGSYWATVELTLSGSVSTIKDFQIRVI